MTSNTHRWAREYQAKRSERERSIAFSEEQAMAVTLWRERGFRLGEGSRAHAGCQEWSCVLLFAASAWASYGWHSTCWRHCVFCCRTGAEARSLTVSWCYGAHRQCCVAIRGEEDSKWKGVLTRLSSLAFDLSSSAPSRPPLPLWSTANASGWTSQRLPKVISLSLLDRASILCRRAPQQFRCSSLFGRGPTNSQYSTWNGTTDRCARAAPVCCRF